MFRIHYTINIFSSHTVLLTTVLSRGLHTRKFSKQHSNIEPYFYVYDYSMVLFIQLYQCHLYTYDYKCVWTPVRDSVDQHAKVLRCSQLSAQLKQQWPFLAVNTATYEIHCIRHGSYKTWEKGLYICIYNILMLLYNIHIICICNICVYLINMYYSNCMMFSWG